MVSASIEEVLQVLEQTILETPKHINNVIGEEEEEKEEKEPDFVNIGDVMDATDPRAFNWDIPFSASFLT